MKVVVFIITLLAVTACERPQWLVEWQQKQLDKRFGRVSREEKLTDINKWQKEAEEYEKQLLKEIDSQTRGALANRRIGSAFAEMSSFELCVRHLEKAVLLGDKDAQTFYRLGLCYGNLAKAHAWDSKYTKLAEENFLKSIEKSPELKHGKYELALIYFHGYAGLNPYRIHGDRLTISQKDFRDKAIEIMEKLHKSERTDLKIRFALAGMYASSRRNFDAISIYNEILKIIESKYPGNFSNRDDYQRTVLNIRQLQGGAKK